MIGVSVVVYAARVLQTCDVTQASLNSYNGVLCLSEAVLIWTLFRRLNWWIWVLLICPPPEEQTTAFGSTNKRA